MSGCVRRARAAGEGRTHRHAYLRYDEAAAIVDMASL